MYISILFAIILVHRVYTLNNALSSTCFRYENLTSKYRAPDSYSAQYHTPGKQRFTKTGGSIWDVPDTKVKVVDVRVLYIKPVPTA